jgi:hypothetical protein
MSLRAPAVVLAPVAAVPGTVRVNSPAPISKTPRIRCGQNTRSAKPNSQGEAASSRPEANVQEQVHAHRHGAHRAELVVGEDGVEDRADAQGLRQPLRDRPVGEAEQVGQHDQQQPCRVVEHAMRAGGDEAHRRVSLGTDGAGLWVAVRRERPPRRRGLS